MVLGAVYTDECVYCLSTAPKDHSPLYVLEGLHMLCYSELHGNFNPVANSAVCCAGWRLP